MKFVYSKYFIYPVFFLTFLAFYSISSNVFSSRNDKFRLLEEDGLEKFCKENDDIYNYYYKSEKYEITEKDFGKIGGGSQIILDFINENFQTEYIFKYIWHTGKYVFFLVLLIIILLLTIYYSIATCFRCCFECCCNFFNFECCKNKCLKKTSCILIPFIYLIVFVLACISISSAALTVQRFSGTICVGLQLVDTFIEGDRRNVHPKWGGVKIVSTVLGDLGNLTSMNNQELVNNITYNKRNYSEKSKEWIQYLQQSYEKNKDKNFTIKNPKMNPTDTEEEETAISPVHSVNWGPYDKPGTILSDIYNYDGENDDQINHVVSIFEKYLYGFLGCNSDEQGNLICTKDSKVSSLLNKGAEIIDQIEEPMSNIKTKITTPVQNIYDQVNSTVMGIFGVVISFVIIYCILIECLLSVFCCTKKCKCVAGCLKWVLCFIYYTSIFIVIIGFVLGIVIGVLGCLVKNMTQVIEYITSTENLNSTKPMIFGENEHLILLDVCLNGDGDMAAKLDLIDSFESVDNITDISDDTEELKNETNITSPYIDYYIDYFNNLKQNYLDIPYYNVDEDMSPFNLEERINEINNYVSGEYSENKEDSCLINETWATETTKGGYTYNNEYPDPTHDSRYLIYLYEEELYNKVHFDTRYQSACPTTGHPYTTVSEASTKFSTFFKDIKDKIKSDEFSNSYRDDLDKLNEIFSKKNEYLIKSLDYATYPINRIGNTINKYISGKDNIFSLLNCKFVGENKLILMHVLYTSLGVYLDSFGIVTCLFSLFIFVGIIFILIVIKNSKLDTKGGADNLDLETLDDILKGNDSGEQLLSSNGKTQELMNY